MTFVSFNSSIATPCFTILTEKTVAVSDIIKISNSSQTSNLLFSEKNKSLHTCKGRYTYRGISYVW